jgi:2-C-methyl-D-erythritol 4-phosphate cytidylyltransferase
MNPKTELVLIHDGARPFVAKDTITSVIKEAKRSQAAIVGVPVKATIKKIETKRLKCGPRFVVEKTLDRDCLWEIQTPQVFKKDLILEAYQRFGNTEVTDDAMLVEKMDFDVSVVPGSYSNIKITTFEDLVLAEAILKRQK